MTERTPPPPLSTDEASPAPETEVASRGSAESSEDPEVEALDNETAQPAFPVRGGDDGDGDGEGPPDHEVIEETDREDEKS